MRIRSIKPDFWRSDDIDALDWHDRLLFIGLWSYVDDNGVGRDRLASIAADLFSGDLERDPQETFARVSRGLQHLSDAGLITRYSVDGRAYLHIHSWEKHQKVDRPNKPRYPLPTSDDAEPRETIDTHSRHTRESPSSGTGEQGNRGIELLVNGDAGASSIDREFDDEFWPSYPRKVKRADAKKAFKRARKTTELKVILDGLAAYIASVAGKEEQYIAHASSWLNGRRWEDEVNTSRQQANVEDDAALPMMWRGIQQ